MVLVSTGITDEERKSYKKVVEKLDEYFHVRHNVIFERARFNRRDQLEGESGDQYITELYYLAERCSYGQLTSEMIRDRLVVGIRDLALSEKLQLNPDLTLEKAKTMIRQREAVHTQQQVLKEAESGSSFKGENSSMDFLRGQGTKTKPAGVSSAKPKQTPKQCIKCGKGQHPWYTCPAKESVCHKCKRRGHYGSQCLSKTVAELQPDESNLDSAFLDTLTQNSPETWRVKLKLANQTLEFKIDTGAEVTAISDAAFRALKGLKLDRPKKMLYGPARTLLKVIGQFEGELFYRGKTTRQNVYVVNGLRTNLLGLPAILALKLVAKLEETVEASLHTIVEKYPTLFQGLGSMGDPYDIQLQPEAQPYALFTSRNIPLPLRLKVKQELERMESLGIISKVDEPTPWCAGMVVAPKKGGAIRICVDYQPLNRYVCREVYPLPKVDETLAQLAGAKIFSKLDANSGFWQIPLTERSKLLTTFITPFGRYYFHKLPFGICSAPEHFQKRMSKILAGLEGVLCQMDDVLVFGRDKEEHNARLIAALNRIRDAGVTLNREKCEFEKGKLLFLGHVIDQHGVQADPEKTSAIGGLSSPSNITELRRFLGMANQMGKFSPNLAQVTQPLRELLSKNRTWQWGCAQEEAFAQVKAELCKPTVLAFYTPDAPTKLSADASSHGLGAVLLQRSDGEWKPVAYASRSMSDTEKRYTQIEKEALATVWACDKFASYIVGLKFHIETDHKPLVPLLGSKHLDTLPPRILRFRLRLARFDFTIQHVPGKLLCTADALSRAPGPITKADMRLEEEAEHIMEVCIKHLPASEGRLKQYAEAQLADPVCSAVMKHCLDGWPERHKIEPVLKPYWKVLGDLSVHNDLLLFQKRIVVPESLQQETLAKLHHGHQGIVRCRLRAQNSVWWPGISQRIKDVIEHCSVCVKHSTPHREPLMPTVLPDYPWQSVAMDLFVLNGVNYVVIVDYFSRYPEVIKLRSTTSNTVIDAVKAVFSRHGIPESVRSDNGPQFSSHEFAKFAASYGFKHTTSSPYFPQSNGLAERTVQTVKNILKGNQDPYLAILTYRSTQLPWCGLSPAQLLMGRQLRTNLPQTLEHLKPEWPYLLRFQEQDLEFKSHQKSNFDRHHRVHQLPDIPDQTEVWITTDKSKPTPGVVVGKAGAPRSYIVETQGGLARRNRHHLNVVPNVVRQGAEEPQQPDSLEQEPEQVEKPQQPNTYEQEQDHQPQEPHRIMTRSQTGTAIRPPERFGWNSTLARKGDVA